MHRKTRTVHAPQSIHPPTLLFIRPHQAPHPLWRRSITAKTSNNPAIVAIISIVCSTGIFFLDTNRWEVKRGERNHRYCVAHKREAIASRLNRSAWRRTSPKKTEKTRRCQRLIGRTFALLPLVLSLLRVGLHGRLCPIHFFTGI